MRNLGLSEPTLRAITELGYEEPTPIQARTIMQMRAGADIIAQAQTGTGKTAAFALPIIEALVPDSRAPQALVMTPTRELAMQVAEAFHSYGKHHQISVLPVYGGQPIERQLRALSRGVDVVVGTPGRLLDHIQRGTLKLDQVRTVVLDEADEMLDMGFIEDIETILKETPDDAPDRAVLGHHARPDRRPGQALHARSAADHDQIRAHDCVAGAPDLLRGRRARQVRGAGARAGFRDAVVGDHLLPHEERGRFAGRAAAWRAHSLPKRCTAT